MTNVSSRSPLDDPFGSAPTGEMRARAAKGMAITGVSQGSRMLLQMVSAVVVARLLTPADYGFYAMVAPIVAFVGLFQSLGISQAVVQKSEVTHHEVSTLYWASFAMSVVLAVVLVAISPLVAAFYKQPGLAPLTCAMGVNLIAGGVGAVHGSLLARQLRFGRMAMIEVASAALGLIVTIIVALMVHSYWAIYAGNLATIIFSTAGNWFSTNWRPALPRRGTGARKALTFGANVTGFNFMNFFARNFDNVLIGWRWGEASLGLYDRAYRLFMFPLQQVNQPVGRVMLPVLSRLANEPERYRRAIQKAMSYIVLLTVPGVAFLTMNADVLIPLLLGEKWSGAIPIFSALGWAALIQTMNTPAGWLLMSQGRGRDFFRLGWVNTLFTVAAFVIGVQYGPVGVAVAYAIVEYVRTPFIWAFVSRSGPVQAMHVYSAVGPVYAGGVLALAALFGLRHTPIGDAYVLLPLSLVVSYGVTLATLCALPAGRNLLGMLWKDGRPVLAKVGIRLA